jgi:AAA ATPase domain
MPNMLTQIRIINFKKLDDVTFELGKSVVLIGPNNSGKTTALQALALWDIGLRRWNEKAERRGAKTSPSERPGVTINRRDLISIAANLPGTYRSGRSAELTDRRSQPFRGRLKRGCRPRCGHCIFWQAPPH